MFTQKVHMMTPEEPQQVQTCFYCDNTSSNGGWADLCNRSCYYGLCMLLEKYESDKVDEPDSRIIYYFTKHPSSNHTFNNTKTLEYIKNKK